MKRFRSFLLFSAVAALLAFAGSAWAATGTIKGALLSRDVARVAVVSTDASFDVVVSSKDSFDKIAFAYVTLSPDLSVDKASFDSASYVLKVGSTEFKMSDKIGIFKVASIDSGVISVDAFAISKDSSYKNKTALRVLAPIALMEVSDDMKVTSEDGYLMSLDIPARAIFRSGDLTLNGLKPVSADDVVIAVASGDTYKKFAASDISKDATYVIVTNKALATAKKEAVKFDISGDAKPTSKDIVITRMIYSSDTKPNLHYGVISSDSKVVSGDGVTVYPFAWEDAKAVEVKVAIYNASADAILKDINIKRYIISGEPVIHYIVSNDTTVLASKDVKVSFASPDTWVAENLTSADLSFDKEISGWKIASGDAYDFTAKNVVTSDLTLYASFDAEAEAGELTVEVSGDKKISTDVEGTLTAIVKLGSEEVSKDVTYQWYKASSTTKSASDDTKAGTSSDIKVSSDVATKLYYYVVVSYDSKTASSDVVTVEVVSAEAEASTTVTLSSLTVTVAPDDKEWDVSVDKADSIDLTMTVVGTFSDSSSKDVTSSTTNTWTLGTVTPTTSAITLSSTSGTTTTIAIAATITSGEYTVPVTAKAVSGDVSKDVTVTYTIVASGSSATPGSDAAKDEAQKAVADAISGITNPSIEDVLKSAEAVAAIGKAVSSTGELDMSVLDGVTSLKGLATLLTTLGNVKSLNFATMGSSLTTIDNLSGVKLDSITLAGNAYITTVDLTGANIPVVNAKGSSALTSITVAGNTNIQELDIGETKVASLDVKGCTSLTTLAVDNTNASGQGSLEELNIEGCENLKTLTLTKNKLLGLKKPSKLNNRMTINATGQARSASFASAKFNFWTFLWNTILGKSGAFSSTAATFDVTLIRITQVNGTTLSSAINPNTTSGDVTFDSTPKGLKYTVDTDGFVPSGFEASSVVIADGSGMDVTLGTNTSDGSTTTEEAKLPSSSGGGCDAGFGFGALAALMAVFALKKKR